MLRNHTFLTKIVLYLLLTCMLSGCMSISEPSALPESDHVILSEPEEAVVQLPDPVPEWKQPLADLLLRIAVTEDAASTADVAGMLLDYCVRFAREIPEMQTAVQAEIAAQNLDTDAFRISLERVYQFVSKSDSETSRSKNVSSAFQALFAAIEAPVPELYEIGYSDAVRQKLREMTFPEQVAQMFLVSCHNADRTADAVVHAVGGVVLYADAFADQTRESAEQFTRSLQDASKTPLLIAVDEEGGTVVRISRNPNLREKPFSSPGYLFRSGGWEQIQSDTVEKCLLLSQLGINCNLAPVCDVSTDPSDYIHKRTLGQDAVQTAEYVRTVVSVMQEKGMGSVLKHFPGYGNNVDTHTGVAIDDRDYETFLQSDFLPFAAGVDAGADAILVSHNVVCCMDTQYPASLSPVVNQILRSELDFDGVVITDDLSMDAITTYAQGSDPAVLAVLAGNDLLCTADFEPQLDAILDAVESGAITEERILESVLRILAWKEELGIL